MVYISRFFPFIPSFIRPFILHFCYYFCWFLLLLLLVYFIIISPIVRIRILFAIFTSEWHFPVTHQRTYEYNVRTYFITCSWFVYICSNFQLNWKFSHFFPHLFFFSIISFQFESKSYRDFWLHVSILYIWFWFGFGFKSVSAYRLEWNKTFHKHIK